MYYVVVCFATERWIGTIVVCVCVCSLFYLYLCVELAMQAVQCSAVGGGRTGQPAVTAMQWRPGGGGKQTDGQEQLSFYYLTIYMDSCVAKPKVLPAMQQQLHAPIHLKLLQKHFLSTQGAFI